MNIRLTSTTPLKITDLLILFIALIFLGWLYYTLWFSQPATGDADTLIVQVMDNAPRSYGLQQDQVLKIKGAQGLSLIEISQHRVRFIHSSCRNKFCIFHGWLTTPGDVMACLPNRVSISLQSDTTEYDALNY